jgi:hypothetical protein
MLNLNNEIRRERLNAENAHLTKDWTEKDWKVLRAILFLSANSVLLEELRKFLETERQC